MAEKSNIMQVHMAEYLPVPSTETISRSGWIEYGDKNRYANHLIELYSTCPVHGSLTKSIVRMIAGKGVTSSAQAEIERVGADKAIPKMAHDLKIQGGYYLEVIWEAGYKKISSIKCLEFAKCRLAYAKNTDDDEIVNGIYYSRDWDNTRKKANAPVFIPRFNPLQAKIDNGRQAYWFFMDKGNNQHYPQPDYEPSMTWIDCERQIGLYHINNLYNGLFPAFIINFMNGHIPVEEQIEMKRDWERKLGGTGNAGKFIMTFNESDKTAPQVITFPISDADKQYEFLSREATVKVMIGHRVTTPRLFGVETANGFASNADEMRDGLKIFTSNVIEPFQRDICDGIDEIMRGQGVEAKTQIVPNTPIDTQPAATPTPVTQSAEKKKPELTDELETALLEKVDGFAEEPGEEWELLSEEQASGDWAAEDSCIEEIERRIVHQANEGTYANGEEKSKFGDKGLYKLRYRYSEDISADSRQFCKKMVALSLAGKVFRYEDIKAMGSDGINGQFAPAGESTYDIFVWKGGAFCHHHWIRQIYFRKRKDGKFLPNDGLKNDVLVGNNPYVPKKGKEAIAPINTPSRGSLKYG